MSAARRLQLGRRRLRDISGNRGLLGIINVAVGSASGLTNRERGDQKRRGSRANDLRRHDTETNANMGYAFNATNCYETQRVVPD